ncbi:MAG: hypothetical protein M0001_05730 [Treponema sp.]|nr:hypothetical protein [Treponema sp.]
MKSSLRRLVAGLPLALLCAGAIVAQTSTGTAAPAPTTQAQSTAPTQPEATAPTQPGAAAPAQSEAAPSAQSEAAPVAPASLVVPPRVDPWAGAPAGEKKVFAEVDDLVAQGKWKSAWAVLAAADTVNGDPWILARSIALALDGHVDTKEHLAFTFVDLAAGTTLEAARKAAVGAGEVAFDPLALADAQATAKIAPVPALDFELGRYLGEVAMLYQGSWRLPSQQIAARESEVRASARAGGVYDAESLRAEAETYLDRGDAANAEILVVAGESLGDPSPRLRYDHAIVFLMQKKYDDGLAMIDATLAVDKDPASRSNGLSLAAQAAALAGKDDKVQAYIDQAEIEQADSPRPLLFGHYLYVAKGEEDKANAMADKAIERFGANPQIISTLVKTWFDAGDPAASLPFLTRGLAAHETDDAAATVFGIYKAMVILRTAASPDDVKDVGALLDATSAHAEKAFPGRKEISNAIDQLRLGLAQMTGAPAPMPPPTAPNPDTVAPTAPEATAPAATAPAPATVPEATAPAATAPAATAPVPAATAPTAPAAPTSP